MWLLFTSFLWVIIIINIKGCIIIVEGTKQNTEGEIRGEPPYSSNKNNSKELLEWNPKCINNIASKAENAYILFFSLINNKYQWDMYQEYQE